MKILRILSVLLLASMMGACSVQLVGTYDKVLDDGYTNYQKALEEFSLNTEDNYRQCLAGSEEACTKASFKSNQESFYIKQTAALEVLRSRATALGTFSDCSKVFKFISKAVDKVPLDSDVQKWIKPYSEGQAVPVNCTIAQVNAILDNHKLMGQAHALLDKKPSLEAAKQAISNDALETFKDTLVQNVKIAVIIENAKKR